MLYKVFAKESLSGKTVPLVRNLISANSKDQAISIAIQWKIALKTNNIRHRYLDYYDPSKHSEVHEIKKKKVKLPTYKIEILPNELSFKSDECPKANIKYTEIYALELK